MKYLLLVCLPVFLSGCALTSAEKTQANAQNKQLATLEQCEFSDENLAITRGDGANGHNTQACASEQDGVLDVIHPVQTVEVPLPQAPEVDQTTEIDDVWMRIADQLAFTIPKNQQRLDSQKKWYLKHPDYMSRVAKRARPFLYYIVEQLEQNDMPVDLALLPIVESSFDPFAYSSGRAAGMWQFIPGTGKRFGMEQNWWYDGRRDVVASTKGAIAYLQYLNKMFDGNWMHALAAYNSGEGRVMRAIRKNKRAGKKTDFWSLDLPKETRAYVPKLLALADILKNSDSYNFSWPKIDNAPVIEVVDVGSQIDLAMAAKMSGLTLAELQALNPGFNKWATSPSGPHLLILPLDKAQQFTLALAETEEKDRLNWERHQVRRGDSIGKIAKLYNTNVDVIKKVNELKDNTIYAGDHLLVPVSLNELDSYALTEAQNSYHSSASKRGKIKLNHTVRAGDTLWDIAKVYDVSVQQISKWNRMKKNDTLRLGKKLVIYVGDDQRANTRSLTYSVRSGDSLSLIASKFNVKVNDILKWNALSKNQYLQIGQRLKLLVDITKS
ncbi:LysM peptidoglycan-binding domain-containing protein [Glaciecola siphonariae]|uniref:LysM peptidoglycan-binding domain-containing protein n=1 Tax=Glaciecola siphonariae TaxID=521012 RepID=A0ABV9LS46_9ALTE